MPASAPAAHHLAQVNVGRTVAPLDSAELAGFMALLDPLNALADAAPGFVWRLQTEEGNATGIPVEEDPLVIINLSVWTSLDDLWQYVYRTAHLDAMRQRRAWFERHVEAYQALWWLPTSELPTVEEAKGRIAHLRAHGPTPHAFGFRQAFAPDGAAVPA
jgi:Domain of unknown function (DUF3291)